MIYNQDGAKTMVATVEGFRDIVIAFSHAASEGMTEDEALDRQAETLALLHSVTKAKTKGPKEALAVVGMLWCMLWDTHGGHRIEAVARGEKVEPV